jgi:hypothetical protein
VLVIRRAAPLACILAIFAAGSIVPATASSPPGAQISKKGKSKKCPKGKKLVTVHKGGKKLKKCRKTGSKGAAPAPAPTPGPAPLFEAPGKRLEGKDAVPFLQKYLYNSTFTDCPAGWPNCAVEQRYSHTSSGSFYYCRLTSVSGADIINGARAYQVQNVVVEADGSWTFNEQVENSGGSAFYEWHVTTAGAVTGAYQFNGGQPEQLGPLQYLGGVAKDCSY